MIQNLKDLQALLKICRKQGVSSIKLGGTEIQFGDLPKKSGSASDEDAPDDPLTEEPTLQQLLDWSVNVENQEGQ